MLLITESRESSKSTKDEAALVRAAQAGDRAAFGEIYHQFARMIHGILLAHVRYSDAEDLMQDVFVRALQRLPALRETGALGGWLASIARHAAFDHHKRIRLLDALPEKLAGGGRPDCEAFEVLGMIQTLPESYRETLVLRLVESMTGPEIAARTGMTAESVRVNLCRGMKLLRAKLEQRAKS
ncbi:MAG: polymerase sigma-70 factor, subfamily [Bryobacterales bacterium]|nr:polymerase sigma-70 factor, subfamily [Bryobacterales bacterium]